MDAAASALTMRQRALLMSAVFLLSAAMLGFQLLQVVILSLQLLPEAAFLVVSFSMLGLGCGGSIATMAIRRSPARASSQVFDRLWRCAVGFSVTAVAATIVTSRLHGLLALIVVNLVPYVFVGALLAFAFAAWSARATEIYFSDLLGAGLGCALIVALLDRLADAGTVAIVLAALAGVAAMLLGGALHVRRVVTAGLVAAAIVMLVPWTDALFTFAPAPEKFYGQLLARGDDGGHVARQSWNFLGRLDAFVPGPAIAAFDFARQAKDLTDAGCAFRLLFSNGYNWTFTVDFRGHEADGKRVFGHWVQNTPYVFTHAPQVLNLGSGGGGDVYLALANGAASATAIEINPLMIEAATRWYAHDWNGLWTRSGVEVRELDARTYVNTTDRTFDVITLNAVDTASTQASLLSVNYLYTTEAFAQYLRVLRPDGVIFLTRPREQLLRAVMAAVAALRLRGVDRIERHVAILGSGELLSAAVYATALTDDRVRTLQARVRDGDLGGALQYAPGLDASSNQFTTYFAAVRDGNEKDAAAVGIRMQPASDDRPYFYQLEPELPRSRAGQLLTFILASVTSIGAILIFAPLLRLSLPQKNRLLMGNIVYFGSLGIGFMLVEIPLMQKLSLLLGHPAYSVSVTLAGMLVFCGLGSLAAGAFGARQRDPIPIVLVAAATAVTLQAVLVDALPRAHLSTLASRVALALAFLAPGSFVLGMPFPLKLRTLARADDVLVPWAWAVNGLASVVGSVLALALSMQFGFHGTLLGAAGFYVAALAAHLFAGDDSRGTE